MEGKTHLLCTTTNAIDGNGLQNFERGKGIDNELEECDVCDSGNSEITLKKNAIKLIVDLLFQQGRDQDLTITENLVRVRTAKYSSFVLTVAIRIIGDSLTAIPCQGRHSRCRPLPVYYIRLASGRYILSLCKELMRRELAFARFPARADSLLKCC